MVPNLIYLHIVIFRMTSFNDLSQLKMACCVELRTEDIKSLWSVLFLLLSYSGLIALVDVSGENRHGVIRLLLGGVNFHTHGLGLTPEGQ
jgi:hypothetical protein